MRTEILTLLFGLLLWPAFAHAQPSATDRSLAQSLFEEAKELMAARKYSQACPKLAESQRLDPGGGTLLNLALCHEEEGKIASAWSDFKEALSTARRDGRTDRIEAAEQHIAALEPKLPWLTLDVQSPVEGQRVSLKGAAVGKAAWGTPVSVDPGTHEVSASAPGYEPWSTTVTIEVGKKLTVTVPRLSKEQGAPREAASASAQPTAAPSQPTPASSARPAPQTSPKDSADDGTTAGWLLAGAGVAALGVGSYFGIRTFQKRSESDGECSSDTTCSNKGVRLNNEAYTSAWLSNIGFGVGLIGVGVGAYLLMSDDTGNEADVARAEHTPTLDAQVLPGGARLELNGAW